MCNSSGFYFDESDWADVSTLQIRKKYFPRVNYPVHRGVVFIESLAWGRLEEAATAGAQGKGRLISGSGILLSKALIPFRVMAYRGVRPAG